MKGQRLFVRESRADDARALRELYEAEAFDPEIDLEGDGLVARLIGDLVAHLAWHVEGNQATISHVYVVKALRGKRVGRGLLQDALSIARDRKIDRLVVSSGCPARAFFLSMGFAETEQGLMMEVF